LPEDVAEAEDVAETGEDVREVREDRGVESGPPARAAVDPGVPEAVVQPALLAVGEDRVGLRRLLEGFLRLVVARIAIRVVLQGQLAIRALDLLIGGLSLDPENLVVISLGHAAHPLATFTIEGRSSRSPSMYPRRNSSMISPSRRPSADSCETAWW
jgi:hypothetical protein